MKPQPMFDLYSDYVRASFGAPTATGLSQRLEGEISHEQVSRHLSGKKKTAADRWLTVKPFIRQVHSEHGVVILDDSIEEKPYTEENDLVCWHYDHSKAALLKGINCLYQPRRQFACGLPLDRQDREVARPQDAERKTAQSGVQARVVS